MTASRIVLIDSQGARALRLQRRTVRIEATFPATPADDSAIDTYLRGVGRADFTLVLNLADETCVPDLLPPAGQRDRRALAARRLASRFPGQAMLLSQHFHDGALPRANLLLYAQTEGPLIAVWRAALSRNGCRLAAIWPLASLLAANSRDPTLIACQTRAGLRITLALQGQFAFTRLAADLAPGAAGTPGVDRVAQELARTRSYLAAQGLIADEVPTVDVAAGQTDHDVQVAGSLPPGHRRPARQMAPPAWRQDWQRHRLAHGLNLATLAAIALASASMARSAWQLGDIGARERTAAADLVALQAQRHRLIDAVADPGGMAEAVAIVHIDRHLAQRQQMLGDALTRLSQGLDRTPSLDLRYLSWDQDAPDRPVRLVARVVCASHAAIPCDPGHFEQDFLGKLDVRSAGLAAVATSGRSEEGRQQLEIALTVAGPGP